MLCDSEVLELYDLRLQRQLGAIEMNKNKFQRSVVHSREMIPINGQVALEVAANPCQHLPH
jgi:hypothetical protein